jgi:hypothetical protein
MSIPATNGAIYSPAPIRDILKNNVFYFEIWSDAIVYPGYRRILKAKFK